ncbi:hypothetical protein ACS0TY_008706 [Phlomoides rotata]
MDDYMMEESVGSSEQLDRLSELPQSLILHILSFLRMRDVVKTTLLSKRWENLWTTLPCLNFSDIISEDDELDSNRVRNFVNRALLFWKGTKLLKFIIEIRDHFDTSSLAGDMDLWVRFAVINKVEELNILLEYDEGVLDCEEDAGSSKDIYRAPECLNSCSSIRKLSLVGCNLRVRKSPTWNQLKSLQINGFSFSERLINRILLGTPRLEVFELSLVESNKNLNIRSTSLKKLKINKYLYFVDEQPSLDSILRICCPNLETLEISGVYYGKCLFTNVSSLTDATLDFYDSVYHKDCGSNYYDARGIELLGETMRYMFSTFQHVERVALSSSSFQMIGAALKKNLFSPLPNVVYLKVAVDLIELVEMVHLLEIFPNLKMLILEDQSHLHSPDINAENYSEFKTNLTKSFMLQLKIIEIISDFYDSSMFWYVEFLLKHCSMLEKLVVRTKWNKSCLQARSLEIAERLLRMSRSSPTAEVIIFNK